jgi:hypothetical protein
MKKFGKEYSKETLGKWELIKECLREGLKDKSTERKTHERRKPTPRPEP